MPIRVYYEVLNQKGTPALYSDNYASRPAAGYVGRIFYSPDTAQIFYDTGTTWTLLADAGVGSGSLASVCANGNTTSTGIVITAGGLSTNSLTSTNLTAGSIPFIGTGGLFSQDNATFFWDNTNKRLGINTATPGAPLDVHGTAGVQIQLNNDTAADSKVAFLNAGVGKWRVGNLYSSGNNLFHIYNNTAGNNAMTINSSNSVTFTGSVQTAGLIANSLQIIQGTTIITSGSTGIGALVNGLTIGLDSGVTQQLYFPTGTAYIYTYPGATGTLVNSSSFSTNTLPKYSSTAGVLTASMLSDDGTTLTSAGATRSNLYLKAVNNTYYSQLAFTNGSNGSYGGISYNNASQYMQFEVNSSEYMRYFSNGNLRLFKNSSTDSNYILQLEANNPYLYYKTTSNSKELVTGLDSNGYVIYDLTAAAYRMILNYSGKVTINAATSTDTLVSYGSSNNWAIAAQGSTTTSSSYGLVVEAGTTSADISFKIRNTSGTNYFWVRGDNLIFMPQLAAGTMSISGGGYITTSSDQNLKIDAGYIENGLNKILQLKPRYFYWNEESGFEDKEKQLGFFAQEVNQVLGDEVSTNKGINGKWGINDRGLIAHLVKAVQELNDKIENLN